jgi:light-regulated signal transduction histidine kinase (bacteriophytochrome)
MPSIVTQRIMMYQVFSNLISNAIKYNNKPRGIIAIDCLEDEADYIFSVKDNGPGIDKDFHEKIFVIFQTLQSRDKIEGTGIGLTIVKRIIEEQGGKIWVESEPGVGATFSFRLSKMSRSQNIL